MAFWNRRKKPEQRMNEWFLKFQDLSEPGTFAGVNVTQDTATNLPAVFRCISLNTDVVSTMPVDSLVKRNGVIQPYPEPLWLRKPNDEQDFGQFIGQVQASLESDGNAFLLKASIPTGQLAAMYVLAPTAVEVDKAVDTGQIVYKVQQNDGSKKPYASTAIVHIRAYTPPGAIRGMSPIAALKQTIGIGMAAEQFGAQYFGSGATMSGIVNVPAAMGDEAAKALAESMKRKHGGISKSHAIGVLTGGAQFTPLSVTPEDSQFLETRRFTDVQIACVYGIPPEHVTEAEGVKGFVTGLFARQWMWLLIGINPRLVRIERALSALMPGGAYIKFNRNSFLAMDPTERGNFYDKALIGRYMVPNEIREKEDWNPLPGGDEALWSVQWGPKPEAKPVEPEPAQAGFLMPGGE